VVYRSKLLVDYGETFWGAFWGWRDDCDQPLRFGGNIFVL